MSPLLPYFVFFIVCLSFISNSWGKMKSFVKFELWLRKVNKD